MLNEAARSTPPSICPLTVLDTACSVTYRHLMPRRPLKATLDALREAGVAFYQEGDFKVAFRPRRTAKMVDGTVVNLEDHIPPHTRDWLAANEPEILEQLKAADA